MSGRTVVGAAALAGVIATAGLLAGVGAPLSVPVYLAAALALAAAALVGALTADRAVTAGPAIAAIAWCAPAWGGWFTGPAVVRTAAAVLAALLPVAVLHTSPRPPRTRWLWTSYVALGTVTLAHSLVADPFLDPQCRTACDADTILIASSPAAATALALVGRLLAALVWTAALASAVRGGRAASRPAAVTRVAVVVAAAAGLLTAVRALDHTPLVIEGMALLVLGSALVLGSILLARQRRDMADLAARLSASSEPGNLEAELGRALGAPVVVRYRLPASERWVGPDGSDVDDRPGPGMTTATITRAGAVVAAVDIEGAMPPLLELGPAARIALDSERMRAAALAQLAQLQESRQRVVETADAARRRIERDLHDGSQQRLVAASYELRSAPASPETARWVGDVLEALAELRALAHGIYPPVLADAGLAPALEAIPGILLDEVPTGRFAPPVELTAYLLVSRTAQSSARVAVRRHGDELVVEVSDGRLTDMDSLRDRAGALGGTLEHDRSVVRAVLPCA